MAVPAALAGIGKTMMHAGAKVAGSSAGRSAASKILRTGEGVLGAEMVMGALKGITKLIKAIVDGVKKLVKAIIASSPALKQQLTIFRKAIEVFLRPIGDILAKFVRPMAIWFLKIAGRWYKWLGGGGAGTDEKDRLEQMQQQRQIAADAGDEKSVEYYDKQIAEMTKKDEKSGTGYKGQKTWSDSLFRDIIPETFKQTLENLKIIWAQLGEIGHELAEIFSPLQPIFASLWEGLKIVAGLALEGVLMALDGGLVIVMAGLEGLRVVLDFLSKSVEGLGMFFSDLWEVMKALGDWITVQFIFFFTNTIPDAWQSMVDKIKEIINKVKTWFSNLSIKSFLPKWGKDKKEEKAVGGFISETGMYKLHAGERVMTAGDTSRSSRQGSVNVSNNIQISATINNDMDIRSIAEKIASYTETQLRRRSSYI